jgi:hypothetical protein
MDAWLCMFFNNIYAFSIEIGKNATMGCIAKKNA